MHTTSFRHDNGRATAVARQAARRFTEVAYSWMSHLRGERRQHELPAFSDHLWRDIGLADLDGMNAAQRVVRQADNFARSRDLRWK